MRTSCIRHPAQEPLLLIRQWQVEACEGNHCAAALLSFLEYWHNIRLHQAEKSAMQNDLARYRGLDATHDTSLYQFHTQAQLENGLLHLYKRDAIRAALKILVSKQFVSIHRNPDPRFTHDCTQHFLFHAEAVNAFLDERELAPAGTENRQGGTENTQGGTENRSPRVRQTDQDPEIAPKIAPQSLPVGVGTPPPPPPPADPPPPPKKQKLVTDYTPGFQAAWETFPSERRLKKPICFAHWKAYGLEERSQEICAKILAMERYVWSRNERRFTPHFSTWLHAGCYDDDLMEDPNAQLAARMTQEETADDRTGDDAPWLRARNVSPSLPGAVFGGTEDRVFAIPEDLAPGTSGASVRGLGDE